MKRSREPEEDSDPVAPGCGDREQGPTTREDTTSSAPAAKIVELDPSSSRGVEMRCSLPPHRETLVFKTYDEFESHHIKAHTNRCLECGKNLPSAHMLDLHHEECHDAFLALKREKGEHTYSCFVEGCERKCSTPQKRRMHLIDKHMYPKNFFFAVTRDGVDGRRSMLLEGGHRHRRSSTATLQSRRDSLADSVKSNDHPPPTEEETDQQSSARPPDGEMDSLAGAMSSLQFVPRGIRFGRGGKVGFAKR